MNQAEQDFKQIPGHKITMFKRLLPLLLSLLYITAGPAQNPLSRQVTEYQIKAAFLYHFTKFVEWPENVVADTTEPFVIGILGRDPFHEDLDIILNGKKAKGKTFFIKRFKSIAQIEPCHILFISEPQRHNLDQIISRLSGQSVLTVGESSSFISDGGMIKLKTKQNKVRFEINLNAAEHAGLRISSRLLRLADNLESLKDHGTK